MRCRGEVAFPIDCAGASVKVDSEYSPEFAAQHLLDYIERRKALCRAG
jgi:hypothetical protein